jgi:hypothetical protein
MMKPKSKSKKREGYLAESSIRRIIGPIPKSVPNREKVLAILRGRASDDRTKALRRAARVWCESYEVQRACEIKV